MRPSRRRRHVVRTSRLESVEPRLLFAAQGISDLSVDYLVEGASDSAVLSTLATADDLTGLSGARATYGFDGSGQTVVVIDTGIAYGHTALGGGLGTTYQVVGGYDFAEDDADPYDDGPAGSHGTHVAGVIAGQDAAHLGVAPGVDLVSLRVFDDSGAGSFQWVEEALQWVHANRNAFASPITTVNLSIGSQWNDDTSPSWTIIEDELAVLEADGIFVAVAAGNSFSSYQEAGLSYPAASSHVVPVMSVDNDGSLSYYSQRHQRAIAAPGRSVLSTVPDYVGNRNGIDDDYARFSGTSMAAPYVAAASTLLREAYQFVGVTGVNQAMLYGLMCSTADVIYDAATGQDYLRLNLQRALDAVMPDDDYGSSAAMAHQLGTIVDTQSISGTVARLGDQDFFTFTAGQTGRVSFTLDAGGTMQTHWVVDAGDSTTTSQGNTLSLHVVAGQTYTVGLATVGGLGHYTIGIAAEADAAPDGTAGRQEYYWNQQISADGQWFTFTAGQQGIATFEAFFAHSQGDVDLELYDANRQFLAGSYSTGNSERIDATAAAGQTFYVRALVSGWGTNGDVDLRLTNLVVQTGDTVRVFGTAGDDQFTFAAGATHQLSINGVAYSFNGAVVRQVRFEGLAGSDTATLTGTAGSEAAVVGVGSAELTGTAFAVRAADVENVTVLGGGGSDCAFLYDSAGNDTFWASPAEARLTGQGFSQQAVGFRYVHAIAKFGGYDTALLYDSAGNDTLVGRPTYTRLYGDAFFVQGKSFDAVYAYATSGGTDVAYLYDSAGNDTFVGKPTESTLSGTGFQIQAQTFDVVHAMATAGGTDRAYLYDSSGDDVFVRRETYSLIRGPGFHNQVRKFEQVEAVSGAGGQDLAYLFDSALSDCFQASGDTATITNARSAVWVYGFDQVYAYGTRGQDTKDLAAVDYVLELRGLWG